ncbi:hypothetical protein CORT_0D07410 [Candida orthopsilosis Co 90-125]|uniref:Uncharacterized protein n=1 Tax=Candida orthopsilosis (strain 90-125) TaxID=1136231 RepID=H8X6G3_CANO9|nr:hypothetical protein CORT_0D07410 [Candida orthopsilosis Co 90-125]CCG23574.1 hypothetical protein CORT_0D07410 [Candida orthopsilosis Co 90-125]
MYVEHRSQIQQQPTSNSVHESVPHSLRHCATTTNTTAATTYYPVMYPTSSTSPSPKPSSSPNTTLPKLQTSGFTNYSHEKQLPESSSTITPSSVTHLHPSSATTTQSSPSKTSPILNSDNKICQWYCCSCGQSYGSVLYKDDYIKQNEFNERPEVADIYRTEKPPTQSTRNYIFDSLKYYSQVVYRDHKHVLSNSPTLVKSDNYFECKVGQSNGEYNHHSHQPQVQTQEKSQELPDAADTPESPRLNPHTPLVSPLQLDLNCSSTSLIEYQDRAILSIPNRFTCHRCDHMMCPYCLKLRLKDI